MAIERNDIHHFNYFLYGEAFYGSYKGLRYRLGTEPLDNIFFKKPEEREGYIQLQHGKRKRKRRLCFKRRGHMRSDRMAQCKVRRIQIVTYVKIPKRSIEPDTAFQRLVSV